MNKSTWWHGPMMGIGFAAIIVSAVLFMPDPRQEQEVVIASVQFPPVEEYCYAPYGEPVEPEYKLSMTLVLVNWMESDIRGVPGYAVWEVQENGLVICVIDVQMPQQVIGDPEMDTLGHELLHCLTGHFHGE